MLIRNALQRFTNVVARKQRVHVSSELISVVAKVGNSILAVYWSFILIGSVCTVIHVAFDENPK